MTAIVVDVTLGINLVVVILLLIENHCMNTTIRKLKKEVDDNYSTMMERDTTHQGRWGALMDRLMDRTNQLAGSQGMRFERPSGPEKLVRESK